MVQLNGETFRFGIFLTQVDVEKTVLYRRVQCNDFRLGHHRKMDGEKEKELYIPQDEQTDFGLGALKIV